MKDERRKHMRWKKQAEERPLYDIEEIMDNISGRDVADYFGLEVTHKGAYDFIHCPGHFDRLGKEDVKANNCILTDHGYHCFACGESVGAIRMIEEIDGCSTYEAIGIAGDIAGGREIYQINQGVTDPGEIQKKERLSSSDLKFIGLLQFKNKSYFPKQQISYDEAKEMQGMQGTFVIKHIINGKNGDLDSEYLACSKEKHFGINQLYRDNYEAYCILIRNKALETSKKYYELLQAFCTVNRYQQMMQKVLHYNMQSLKNEYLQDYNRAHRIYLRFQNE